jgi:3-hydroxyanthranilate 3,4-dioxygenase
VIERKRAPQELDGFVWYCEKCGQKLYEEFFHLDNIVTQLPPVFERFYASEKNLTCTSCGTKMPPRKV